MRRSLLPLLMLLVAGTTSAQELSGHIDFYRTNLDGDDASLEMREQSLLGGSNSASADFSADAGPETGVRAMVAGGPWLVGIDMSYFATDAPQLELDAFQLAVVGGLRTPRPLFARNGHGLHPYVLVGVSGVAFDGKAELAGIRTDISGSSGFSSSGPSQTAAVFAVGFEWRLSPRLGLIAEYRRRDYDIEGVNSNSWVFPTYNSSADGTLEASGLTIGLGWWFDAAPAPVARDLATDGEDAARMPAPSDSPAAP